jgi:hypothetical protein
MKKNLFIVVCSFNVEPKLIIKRLDKIFNRYDYHYKGVIVCNKNFYVTTDSSNWNIIEGSNEFFDFSAYFEGLVFLNNNHLVDSNILFLNDSIFLKHDFKYSINLILKANFVISEIITPSLIGFRSHYTTICLFNPWSKIDVFIPTYIFIINNAALNLFISLKSNAEIENIFTDNINDWSDNIPYQFKVFLNSYIFNNNFNNSWDGNKKYILNKKDLYKKARCVYFEHKLSGEIGLHGNFIFPNVGKKSQIIFSFRNYFHKLFNLI